MIPADFVSRYIVDWDYSAATVSANGDTARGSTVDNSADVYPGTTKVEYFEQGNNATDWSALRMVLMPVDGKWLLFGIIHDAWAP